MLRTSSGRCLRISWRRLRAAARLIMARMIAPVMWLSLAAAPPTLRGLAE
ncbi:MAG: hypothetical protein E7L06_08350 [Schaalia turicensis]|nr:hypothetical protein [Schaalia turicensis]